MTRYEPLAGQRSEHEFYSEGTETSPTDGGGRRKSVLPSLPTASVQLVRNLVAHGDAQEGK